MRKDRIRARLSRSARTGCAHTATGASGLRWCASPRLCSFTSRVLTYRWCRAGGITRQSRSASSECFDYGVCMKKLIVFDLDGTLARSKSSLDREMSTLLADLLGTVKVAVISGGAWPQFEEQLLSHLPHDKCLLNLSLLPTCGTQFYRYSGEWKKIYSEDFTADEREKIVSSLKKAFEASGFKAEKVWGDVIEDRGSQITLSALGQQAPLEEKEKW